MKYALSLLGLMAPTLRLPLVMPSEQVQSAISAVLAELSQKYADQMIGAGHALEHNVGEPAVGCERSKTSIKYAPRMKSESGRAQ